LFGRFELLAKRLWSLPILEHYRKGSSSQG
jgi:hypothetical protein